MRSTFYPPEKSPANALNNFPFELDHWKAVDDRVRGGSSQSYITSVGSGVRFYGTLDINTLGGAGFASQTYIFPSSDPLQLPIEIYSGLSVSLSPTPSSSSISPASPSSEEIPQTLTLVLKTQEATQRPDGRLSSTVSYEAQLHLPSFNILYIPSSSLSSSEKEQTTKPVFIPFDSFKPSYRGRTPPDAKPLDPSSISSISLMCRSDFGKQQGPFDFRVHDLRAIHREGESVGRRGMERVREGGAWSWVDWFFRWISSFFQRNRRDLGWSKL
ncbi:NADH:ubiquinone oxidoreductase intermediate-associated protein 30 [Phaffia rhodozyma]|uniref:NADH:ubiquinone oxidoreductase intermediate-associated protein 30 n=1 Tax=Phaffia rhodozyma TaxID=264483 RepID=A0A0F7SLL3_PHARH|nr:NADH:ubiquinone oxidoreductase intermediate-associated protein 30 [Phaffia rhodozyma]